MTVKAIYIASNCYRGVGKDGFEYTVNFGETKETGETMDIQIVLPQQVVLHLCNLFFLILHSTAPGPPTKFRGKVLSDKEILITWEEPINANGIIKTYHIRAYETKTGREVYNKTVGKGLYKEQSQYVPNLNSFTTFTFTIQAKTIELGEMANFTAKTGGKFELFMCLTL